MRNLGKPYYFKDYWRIIGAGLQAGTFLIWGVGSRHSAKFTRPIQLTMSNSRNSKVAVVTGSNKGIGLAIVRALCKQFNGAVFLTSRSECGGDVVYWYIGI